MICHGFADVVWLKGYSCSLQIGSDEQFHGNTFRWFQSTYSQSAMLTMMAVAKGQAAFAAASFTVLSDKTPGDETISIFSEI